MQIKNPLFSNSIFQIHVKIKSQWIILLSNEIHYFFSTSLREVLSPTEKIIYHPLPIGDSIITKHPFNRA